MRMGGERIDPHFLELGTSCRWVTTFKPRPLYPRKKTPPPGTHWMEGRVHQRAGLDDVEKRKFLSLPGFELRPFGRPTSSQSLYRQRLCEPRTAVMAKASSSLHESTSCSIINYHIIPFCYANSVLRPVQQWRRLWRHKLSTVCLATEAGLNVVLLCTGDIPGSSLGSGTDHTHFLQGNGGVEQ
jgi:hypothetical protein